ncbi:MAG: LVIVD repeat-containing protein, partial [Actinomycetota bacterium]
MPSHIRLRLGTALVALATLAAGAASASHRESPKNAATKRLHSHARPADHPPHESSRGSIDHTPTTENFDILAHARLPHESPHGDVYFYDHGGEVGKHVYVGTWAVPCSGTGVKIIDVNDPASPTVVDLAGRHEGSSNEDMAVVHIGDRDILGVGVQSCGTGGKAGLRLIDVTDPSNARKIAFIRVPAAGVHELDLTVRPDGRALALLAVPFSEFDDVYGDKPSGGDFRIVDITDPSNPVPLSDWGVIADSSLPIPDGDDEMSSPFQGIGYFSASYGHSVRAADDGMTAYVSYWDAGVLKFDISDPADPRLVARTTYPFGSDGDGHSMTPYEVGGKTYILQNDEDFTSLSPSVVTSSATGAESFAGIEEEWMPTLLSETGEVSGEIHDADDGCQESDYNGGTGRIILVDTVDPFYEGIIEDWRVPCGIGRQLMLAVSEEPTAVLLNLISNDDAWGFAPSDRKLQVLQSEAEDIPAVQMSDIDGVADAIRAQLDDGSVTATLTPKPTTWGFLRIFGVDQGDDLDGDGIEELEQVGEFSDLPHVAGELQPPAGTWSIHNTEVLGERAYSSWYSHGIVALSLEDPENPVKVGQFIPSSSGRFRGTFGPPGPQ